MIAEYGSYSDAERSTREVMASAPLARSPRTNVDLARVSPGYEPAGSVARWTDGGWSVRYFDGAYHGRRFRIENEADARAYFARLTA